MSVFLFPYRVFSQAVPLVRSDRHITVIVSVLCRYGSVAS